MTVFKGYMLLAKRNIKGIIVYFTIFTGIAVAMGMSRNGKFSSFTATKLNIAVVDRDRSECSEEVVRFLKKNHHVTEASYDPSALQERLYYENVKLVVCIQKGFEKDTLSGKGGGIEYTQNPGEYNGMYVEAQLNRLVQNMKQYYDAGYSVSESYDKVAKTAAKQSSYGKYQWKWRAGSWLCRVLPLLSISDVSRLMYDFGDIAGRISQQKCENAPECIECQLIFTKYNIYFCVFNDRLYTLCCYNAFGICNTWQETCDSTKSLVLFFEQFSCYADIISCFFSCRIVCQKPTAGIDYCDTDFSGVLFLMRCFCTDTIYAGWDRAYCKISTNLLV